MEEALALLESSEEEVVLEDLEPEVLDVYLAMQALDDWEEPEIEFSDEMPAFLQEEILADLSKERSTPFASEWKGALIMGSMTAWLSLFVLSFYSPLPRQSTIATIVGALAWMMAFFFTSWSIFKLMAPPLRVRSMALLGLGAMTTFIMADNILPLARVTKLCYACLLSGTYLGFWEPRAAFFLFGLLYVIGPLFVMSFFVNPQAQSPEPPLKRFLMALSLVLFLITPAVFLQCSAFTVGTLMGWMLGSILGSLIGGFAGTKARQLAFYLRP